MRILQGCKPEGGWNVEITSINERNAALMMNGVMSYNVEMNEKKSERLGLLIAKDASIQSQSLEIRLRT